MESYQAIIKAELKTVMQGIDEIAQQIIEGLDTVLEMKSPYPDEYQEIIYKAARYGPGGGFDQMISEEEVEAFVEIFRKKGIL